MKNLLRVSTIAFVVVSLFVGGFSFSGGNVLAASGTGASTTTVKHGPTTGKGAHGTGGDHRRGHGGGRVTEPIYRHPVFVQAVRHRMCGTPCTGQITVCTSKGGTWNGSTCVFPTPTPAPTPTPTPVPTPTPTPAPSCNINSISAPGTVGTIGTQSPSEVSGSMSVTCTNGHGYNIEMNAGLYGADGNTPTRYVANGGYRLQYQIYRDSGKTLPWGDYPGTNTYAATGSGGAQGFTFYVQVFPPPLSIPSGAYSDTVTVTVAY